MNNFLRWWHDFYLAGVPMNTASFWMLIALVLYHTHSIGKLEQRVYELEHKEDQS